jgi:hypothetical protein
VGLDLHYTIFQFFEKRMNEHSHVASVQRLNVEGECIYEIERSKFRDRVKVWHSDAYMFTEMDYYNRPKELKAGDYILIAKPEADGRVRRDLIDTTKIGVGKLKELMGALTVAKTWTYISPTESALGSWWRRAVGRL